MANQNAAPTLEELDGSIAQTAAELRQADVFTVITTYFERASLYAELAEHETDPKTQETAALRTEQMRQIANLILATRAVAEISLGPPPLAVAPEMAQQIATYRSQVQVELAEVTDQIETLTAVPVVYPEARPPQTAQIVEKLRAIDPDNKLLNLAAIASQVQDLARLSETLADVFKEAADNTQGDEQQKVLQTLANEMMRIAENLS